MTTTATHPELRTAYEEWARLRVHGTGFQQTRQFRVFVDALAQLPVEEKHAIYVRMMDQLIWTTAQGAAVYKEMGILCEMFYRHYQSLPPPADAPDVQGATLKALLLISERMNSLVDYYQDYRREVECGVHWLTGNESFRFPGRGACVSQVGSAVLAENWATFAALYDLEHLSGLPLAAVCLSIPHATLTRHGNVPANNTPTLPDDLAM